MRNINQIMQDIYEEDLRKHLKLMNVLDTQMYERPYTEAEQERLSDVANMERQYWADQYALAKSKFKLAFLQLLYLHKPVNGSCQGCDVGGWEGEAPEWPCRTIKVAIKGVEDWPLQLDRPVRPLRKRGKGHVTFPINTKRGKNA